MLVRRLDVGLKQRSFEEATLLLAAVIEEFGEDGKSSFTTLTGAQTLEIVGERSSRRLDVDLLLRRRRRRASLLTEIFVREIIAETNLLLTVGAFARVTFLLARSVSTTRLVLEKTRLGHQRVETILTAVNFLVELLRAVRGLLLLEDELLFFVVTLWTVECRTRATQIALSRLDVIDRNVRSMLLVSRGSRVMRGTAKTSGRMMPEEIVVKELIEHGASEHLEHHERIVVEWPGGAEGMEEIVLLVEGELRRAKRTGEARVPLTNVSKGIVRREARRRTRRKLRTTSRGERTAAATAAALLLQIVSATFLAVAKDLVGFVDFLERFFGSGRGVLIRMELQRFLAIGFANLVVRRRRFHAEHCVTIAELRRRHHCRPGARGEESLVWLERC